MGSSITIICVRSVLPEVEAEPWAKREPGGSLAHKLQILDDLEKEILIRSGWV